MDEIQTQFVADAQELVEKLYHDLERLRSARLHGPHRRELAARIFRRVHTLKGSAGTLGLKSVSKIAHEFEGVLDGVRLGRLEITDEVIDAFEDAVDAIARALELALSGAPQPGTTAVTQNLNAMAAKSRHQGSIATSLRSALPPEIARSLSEYDLQHAREAIREGAKLFIVSAGFAIETFDERFRELSHLLGQSGEIIATVPGESAAPDEITFRLLYAAELVANETMRQAATLGRIETSELRIEPSIVPARQSAAPSLGLLRSTGEGATASVRIELGRLNELISDASELFRETNRALSSVDAPLQGKGVEATGARLRRQFVELEERMIKLRLVPCAEILERAATRAGRIAARQLGKQVEFEIAGSEVGIDSALADMLAEPLLHLVRNAVSHGIESPEERTAAGKPTTGRVKLAAFSEASRIHITVSDDGRGIDLDRIAEAAREQGIANGASLTMDQCLRLIFRPGFSTTAEVSELSGRGIGLDVVDRAMEQAGGEARVATEPGAGTTFVMILPAGLALVRCQTVRCGQRYYGIGSGRVIGGRLLEASELAEILSSRIVDWEGENLAVFLLPDLISESSEAITSAKNSLLVWQADHHRPARAGVPDRVALVVDSIEAEHETLVRSLGRHAARWHGVAGAAQLSDGNVALILDVEELIKTQSEG
ncbi:MAG TPA: ATP-binding protein [Pyrinomonadaceae bacterium]|nr:ATP-binding protein [Pyrinomonadaceae bacterium]